jgi:hypothetical protein
VPVFLRIIRVGSNTDNQKQNKGPLRLEGIDIDKYGEKVPNGQHDVVMWAKPGANTYVRFTLEDLQALRDGKISI